MFSASICGATAQNHSKNHDLAKIQLNAEQRSSLQTLKKEMRGKKQSILSDQRLSEGQKREQLRALKMDRKKQIKKILTPAQMHQLKKMRKEEMKRYYQSDPDMQRRRIIERSELGSQF